MQATRVRTKAKRAVTGGQIVQGNLSKHSPLSGGFNILDSQKAFDPSRDTVLLVQRSDTVGISSCKSYPSVVPPEQARASAKSGMIRIPRPHSYYPCLGGGLSLLPTLQRGGEIMHSKGAVLQDVIFFISLM